MPRPPNLLVVFSDQQRWDTVGCYGQSLPLTPNLDRMAGEGVRFRHAFTCQPVCGPARSALMSGLYPTATGCFTNGIALPPGCATIARRLRAAGYEAGYIGKWHLASNDRLTRDPAENFRTRAVPPERRGGFDDFWLASDVLEFTSHGDGGYMHDGAGRRVDFAGYRVDACTDFALDYLRSRDRRRPFFCFLSYIEPHHQNDRDTYEGPPGSKERWRDFPVPGDLAGQAGDWRQHYPDYLGCVHSLDANLGRLRAELAALGLADDTLVIYTSDHGNHFRTRNSEYKRSCHEASIRIPLIACGPGFRGGQVVESLASLIDLPPTLLCAAGVDAGGLHGRPLHDAVAGASDWPDEVLVQISEAQVGRAIRTPRWKYGIDAPDRDGWQDAGSARYVEQHLYDLAADPHERHDLVRDPALAGLRADLAVRLRRRMAAVGEPPAEIAPAP